MKKLLLIVFMLPILAFGQQQLSHEKQMFTNNEGRLFINKSLPIYLKVSSTPESNSEKELLKSKTSPQNSNPLYFNNEGLNYFYSPWAVDTVSKKVVFPKQYIKFEIYADSKPPRTSIHNNTTAYDKGDTLFFGKDLKLSFKSEDKVSGVSKTYYSIDGEEFKEYKEQLTFGEEKSYIIKFYTVDNVGNVEEVQKIEFTIDSSKPLTNLNIIGDHIDNIISGRASIALIPQDAFSGASKTFYVIDNNEKTVYSQAIKAIKLREGKHTLNYFTEDEVENREDEKKFIFYVDKSPPLVIDEIIGDVFFSNGKEFSSGRTQLQLTAIDNRAGVKSIYYSLDNKNYSLYEKPFFLPQKQGNVFIDFYADDKVNNSTKDDDRNNSRNNKYFQSFVDLTAPILNYNIYGEKFFFNNTLYISPETKIELTAKDAESGIQKISYTIDKENEKDYLNKLSIKEDGEHIINYYGYDNVNNSAQNEIKFTVDGTAPEIISQFNMASISKKKIGVIEYDVYPKHFILYLSAIDNMVGSSLIYYSINDKPERVYTTPIQNLESKQTYDIKIRAFDYMGNSTNSQIKFYVQE